jgi:hypothetical protein
VGGRRGGGAEKSANSMFAIVSQNVSAGATPHPDPLLLTPTPETGTLSPLTPKS